MGYDEENEVKKTKKFCSHRGDGKELKICSNTPQWRICNEEKRVKLKVCDEHLAWGIRCAGYPAIVDAESQQLVLEKD